MRARGGRSTCGDCAVAGSCTAAEAEPEAIHAAGGGAGQRARLRGWEDQRWKLERVRTVIGRRFHLTYTVQGVRKLLVRNGWSCQVPARRAMEWDDGAVAGWVKEVGP
ncbi:winged helix-turn-helix domain-containing protein [Streptomyces sp. NPDC059083]|uniref:helix-turn-helix domain-containing protein n=1 Tax=unclassified Streptomyces TaxID=2593676 RepID=UPI003697B03D